MFKRKNDFICSEKLQKTEVWLVEIQTNQNPGFQSILQNFLILDLWNVSQIIKILGTKFASEI